MTTEPMPGVSLSPVAVQSVMTLSVRVRVTDTSPMPLAVPVKLPDTPLAEVLVEALRANTHEFLNKLHVISGLLQIGETQKAIAFINGVSEDVEDNYQGIIRQRQYTTKGDGHGFGLRLIQQIVAGRRGYLEIESEPGEGSSFTVNFTEKREAPEEC